MLTDPQAIEYAERLIAACFEFDRAGDFQVSAPLSLAIDRLLESYPAALAAVSWPLPDSSRDKRL